MEKEDCKEVKDDASVSKETPTEASGEPAEAEPTGAAGGGGGDWWGGWMSASVLESAVNSVTSVTSSAVQVAKTKSSEVYGLVSKDLSEVSSQASNVVGSAASTVKKTLEMDWYYCDSNAGYFSGDPDAILPPDIVEQEDVELDDKTDEMADKAVSSVKKSVSSFWKFASGYAQQMFTEDDLESEAMVVRGNNPVLMDRLQAQLYALASDPDTFATDPDPEDSADWKEWNCDLEKRQGEISDLMMSSPNVRQHYTDMVPASVTHKQFWNRYFYRVHLLELQEARRQALKKRAEQSRLDSEPGINWDDVGEDFASSSASAATIPTEVQDKLLSDYERELITKKLKKGEQTSKKRLDDVAAMTLSEEIDRSKSAAKGSGGSSRSSPGSSAEKESVASDDWEKLSAGEKSPIKSGREEEEWVKP